MAGKVKLPKGGPDDDKRILFTPYINKDGSLEFMGVDFIRGDERPKFHEVLMDEKDLRKLADDLNERLRTGNWR